MKSLQSLTKNSYNSNVKQSYFNNNFYFINYKSFARKDDIIKKLNESFKPTHLEVFNESHMHSVPKNSETHFKVLIVSDIFNKKAMIENHRSVNKCLDYELKNGMKALSIIAKTPEEYEKSSKKVPDSPKCLGNKNDKKDKLH